jgi:hypothetical protein
MRFERIWIPMLNKSNTVTQGEVFKFYQAGPWAVTLPANLGRGFVVTHLPSGAFALPFGKGGDLDYEVARKVVDDLAAKVSHSKALSSKDLSVVRSIVEDLNEMRWDV